MASDEEILEPKAKAYFGHSFTFFKKEMQQFVLNAMREAREDERKNLFKKDDLWKFFRRGFDHDFNGTLPQLRIDFENYFEEYLTTKNKQG